MPKIIFLITFMAKKCHFMPDNLHLARGGPNYETRNSNEAKILKHVDVIKLHNV